MILIFTPRQIRWLRRHLTWYLRTIDQADSGNTTSSPQTGDLARHDPPHTAQFLPTDHSSTIDNILRALPHQGGVVVIDDSERRTWAWALRDLARRTLDRLKTSDDGIRSARAADGLTSWLSDAAARLTTDRAVDDRVEPHLPDLVDNPERRRN